ncbi:MAG: class I SAM-dependent methyltransferase [bacterium]|nr:class I SAM-dependent methyltransferase [bacterium]
MHEHPFDAAAPEYDESFVGLAPGTWFRSWVWKHATQLFKSGDEILDLGCGTGEDAVFLAKQGIRVHAVDISPGMLEVAREKVERAGLEDLITLERGSLTAIASHGDRLCDGFLSDFGPLNCLEHLAPFVESAARSLRPGAPMLLVVMGPVCPWEIAWYLMHLRFPTAFRRLTRGLDAPVGGGPTIKVWYHSPRALRRALRDHFDVQRLIGIGTLVPPPYLSGLVTRAPRLFKGLNKLDRRLGHIFPFNRWNDHYMLIATRK